MLQGGYHHDGDSSYESRTERDNLKREKTVKAKVKTKELRVPTNKQDDPHEVVGVL
jgi:hypothetical protein